MKCKFPSPICPKQFTLSNLFISFISIRLLLIKLSIFSSGNEISWEVIAPIFLLASGMSSLIFHKFRALASVSPITTSETIFFIKRLFKVSYTSSSTELLLNPNSIRTCQSDLLLSIFDRNIFVSSRKSIPTSLINSNACKNCPNLFDISK